MDPLLSRLEAANVNDVEIMPLLDALIHLTMAIGGNVEPYARRMLTRSVEVAETHLSTNTTTLPRSPQADAIATFALDAITALVETLQQSSAALLEAVGSRRVLSAASAAAAAPDGSVQQSGFALIGELSLHIASTLGPSGPQFLAATLAALQRGVPPGGGQAAVNALNNAAWAAGLLIEGIPAGGALEGTVMMVAERLSGLLPAEGTDGSLRRVRENAAISLGRVALVLPAPLAPHLPQFIGIWCATLAALQVWRPVVLGFFVCVVNVFMIGLLVAGGVNGRLQRLLEDAVISLGPVALVWPSPLAPRLPQFIWCATLAGCAARQLSSCSSVPHGIASVDPS
jgi:transportin-1